MRYLFWSAIVLSIFLVQGRISFFDVTPSLTSLLVYYVGMRNGDVAGIFFGSLIGTIEDSLSGSFLGPHLLSKGLVGYFSSFLSGSFFKWTPLLGVIGISTLTFFDNALVFASRGFFNKLPSSIQAAVFIITIKSIMNAPLGVLIRPKE